jgi:hypothetical protein
MLNEANFSLRARSPERQNEGGLANFEYSGIYIENGHFSQFSANCPQTGFKTCQQESENIELASLRVWFGVSRKLSCISSSRIYRRPLRGESADCAWDFTRRRTGVNNTWMI